MDDECGSAGPQRGDGARGLPGHQGAVQVDRAGRRSVRRAVHGRRRGVDHRTGRESCRRAGAVGDRLRLLPRGRHVVPGHAAAGVRRPPCARRGRQPAVAGAADRRRRPVRRVGGEVLVAGVDGSRGRGAARGSRRRGVRRPATRVQRAGRRGAATCTGLPPGFPRRAGVQPQGPAGRDGAFPVVPARSRSRTTTRSGRWHCAMPAPGGCSRPRSWRARRWRSPGSNGGVGRPAANLGVPCTKRSGAA